jgi:ELWxxDGT repeat protein
MNVRIFGVGLILAGSLAMASSASELQASGRVQPAAISVDVGTVDRISEFGVGGGKCLRRHQIDGEVLGSKLLFWGDDGLTGCELWITDGTHAGTMLVKDIATGVGFDGLPNSSYPSDIVVLPNGQAIFRAEDTTHGRELWVTDGTSAGTMLLKDIATGANAGGHPNDSYPENFAVLANGRAVFQANNGDLWSTDGTSAGTMLVKDSFDWRVFAVLPNGQAVFQNSDLTHGTELWVTDGTSAGTMLVKDIATVVDAWGQKSSYPENFAVLPNGRAVFQARDATHGAELWITDGTSAGTMLVKDIAPGDLSNGIPNGSYPRDFAVLPNGRAVFTAEESHDNRELWVTDGTGPGTMLLKDISANGAMRLFGLTVIDANVYFWANDGVNGAEPWVTDGTSANTKLVADINNSGDSSPTAESSSQFIKFGDQVYFQANNGINGMEIWSTSPLLGGARIVADIWPGSDGSMGIVYVISSCRCERAKNFVSLNGRLIFWANDGSSGSQLWAMGDFPSPPQNVVVDSVTLSSASISWSAPSLVGTGVTSYTVTSNPGGYMCSTTTLSCTVTGLTTNAYYTFTVVATGPTGGGLPTTSPRARMLVILPGPSRSVAVSPSSHSASVSWLAPATGGIGIETYTVTSNPSGFTCTTVTLSCTVTGLLSNQDYTFSVVATNPRGDGPSVTSSRVRTPSPQLGSLVDSLTPVSNIVSDSVLHPGDALNVLYSGFNPNELVLLLIASNPVVIGSANADANGNVVFLTSIPAGTATGSHHLIVYAPVSGFGASQAVTVTIPTPVAGTTGTVAVDNPVVNPDTLPATGRGVIPFLVALTLLIAGLALLSGRGVASRRG